MSSLLMDETSMTTNLSLSEGIMNSMNSMHSIECRICLTSPPLIPVWFTCFPCRRDPANPTCSSLCRVCMTCARKYLESDMKKAERSTRKRCLQCQAFVNPKTLTVSNPGYEKDFLMMSLDSRKRHCIFHDRGCEYMGTQMEILHHSLQECAERDKPCDGCHKVMRANKLSKHIEECNYYEACPYEKNCGYWLKRKMEDHLRDVHQRKVCSLCSDMVPLEDVEQHEQEECVMRLLKCTICGNHYTEMDSVNHFIGDLSNLYEKKKKQWSTIRTMYEEMEDLNTQCMLVENILGNSLGNPLNINNLTFETLQTMENSENSSHDIRCPFSHRRCQTLPPGECFYNIPTPLFTTPSPINNINNDMNNINNTSSLSFVDSDSSSDCSYASSSSTSSSFSNNNNSTITQI